MKKGTTPLIPIKLNLAEVDKIQSIIFTIGELTRKFPETVKYENGIFYIPLTQNETETLNGVTPIEAQINFKDNQVAKSEIKKIFVEDTLKTTVIGGGNVDGTLEDTAVMLTVNDVIIGQDGFSPVAKVEKSGNKSTITITDKNGTTVAEILDGKDGTNGTDGINGVDGVSVSSATINSSGHLILTFSNGQTSDTGVAKGTDGKNGDNGVSVTNAVIKADGHLMVTLSSDETIDAGIARDDTELAKKQDKPDVATITENTLTVSDNAEYYGENITALTVVYPTGNFECWLKLTFAETGTITVTLPSSRYIGEAPQFKNGETWEISIKDGVVVAQKLGDSNE